MSQAIKNDVFPGISMATRAGRVSCSGNPHQQRAPWAIEPVLDLSRKPGIAEAFPHVVPDQFNDRRSFSVMGNASAAPIVMGRNDLARTGDAAGFHRLLFQ